MPGGRAVVDLSEIIKCLQYSSEENIHEMVNLS